MTSPPELGAPWSLTAARVDGPLHVGGVAVDDLASEFGTPLWVVDEQDLRSRCGQYVRAFPDGMVTYASKAWSALAILEVVADEGLWIDVASDGELHAASTAGVPPDRIVLHGNNKSSAELEHAIELGVARIVVDSLDELARLEAIGRPTACWLRITPGIDAHTHEYVRTGHDDSKFGFSIALGLADKAYERASAIANIEVVGVHAHVGSQIFGTEPFEANTRALIGLVAAWRERHGVVIGELNVGGGMGIHYGDGDEPSDPSAYAKAVLAAAQAACAEHEYPMPRIAVEPGRAIVAQSTLTLYRVGTIKRLPGLRTYVSVDGGMSDNIRPALYGAAHEVALVGRQSSADLEAFTIVGKHCESGDLVREDAALPADLAVGDVLAVASTGAYTESMASNYNRLPRPAAVMVRDGQARLILRRETNEDLLRRDVPLDNAKG